MNEERRVALATIKEVQRGVDLANRVPRFRAITVLAMVAVSSGVFCIGTSHCAETKPLLSTSGVSADADTSEVKWLTDFEQAIVKAKRLERPLLIDFAASWCVPCRIMDKKVWPDASVQKALENEVVPLRVDMDGKHAPPLIEKFKVEFVPTILIVDQNENELAREGFVNAEEFLEMTRKLRKE
ncbi:thioredoxin family protein [Aporhodopirellula aestuarii]|uniref:Thioredoxin family protein n=1 Tax=Aporhodopirellula aestuarii TaxID=2950107 RepID=A0ABT0TZW8_9BACT|nr:thioredoxin family protein [Aporhodopirellula aestuarii]MCM2370153.1 thioredoxin family protein [Aporhodopirellula aestuarii]